MPTLQEKKYKLVLARNKEYHKYLEGEMAKKKEEVLSDKEVLEQAYKLLLDVSGGKGKALELIAQHLEAPIKRLPGGM